MSADMPETDRDRMQALADHFRGQAEACRQLAESATNPLIEAQWRRLTEEWVNLATDATTLSERQ
jgi:CTP:molybdopterin cytidylyltransferase MocA